MTNCEQPQHDGLLTIDLSAVQRNWQRMRGLLRPGAECGAVIKADAYGLGADPVSRSLYHAGCRTFFVATVREGMHIRYCLPEEARILILGGMRPGREADCLAHNLIPVLFTVEQLRRWRAVNQGAATAAPCAIKIDTGMTRLGLRIEDFDRLCEERDLLRACNPILLMSQLACADEPEHPLNQSQLRCFRRAAEKLSQWLPGISLSLANSSGICLGEDWHFDLARPGASLYGVNPQPARCSITPPALCAETKEFSSRHNIVEPVAHLQLPIAQIREVDQPDVQVGYGATRRLDPPARLAAVFGGYADGIHRTLGNRGMGELWGRRVPIVGRISMDCTVFDISDVVPERLPVEGYDCIHLLSETLTVDEIAAAAGTIGYEILTSLGDRYQRRYINGDAVEV